MKSFDNVYLTAHEFICWKSIAWLSTERSGTNSSGGDLCLVLCTGGVGTAGFKENKRGIRDPLVRVCRGLESAAQAASAARAAAVPGRIRDLKGEKITSVDFAFFGGGGAACRVPAETPVTPVPWPAALPQRGPVARPGRPPRSPRGARRVGGAPPAGERPPAGLVVRSPPGHTHPASLRGSPAAAGWQNRSGECAMAGNFSDPVSRRASSPGLSVMCLCFSFGFCGGFVCSFSRSWALRVAL